MNFQIFFGFIVVCYICYYLGIVAYDLMVNSKRAASEDDKAQDETVDISDEVREFTPILITRPIIKKQKAAALKRVASRWSVSCPRWRNFHKMENKASWADCYKIGKKHPTNSRILHNNIPTFIFNISDVAL